MEKYFMHRIKKENDTFTTGIEVHDSKESAILSFHSYMKQGYGNPSFPNITYIACMVQNPDGTIDPDFDARWDNGEEANKIFFHHIRENNGEFDKNIDVYDDTQTAEYRFHSEMEYGYGNTKHNKVTYEACLITELLSSVVLKSEKWEKTVEPEIQEG